MPAASSSRRTDPAVTRQLRTYFTSQPPAVRRALKQLQAIIRAAVPGAVDAFSYRIPAFRLEGRVLIWYAGWKAHTSLYPLTGATRRAVAKELAKYQTSKGTIRFPIEKPIPQTLIRRIVKARAAELREEQRKR